MEGGVGRDFHPGQNIIRCYSFLWVGKPALVGSAVTVAVPVPVAFYLVMLLDEKPDINVSPILGHFKVVFLNELLSQSTGGSAVRWN